jgi:hypothetical protein
MGKSELFSYLSAFVTIVLAIAMTDMLQSTHRLLRGRNRIIWDARPLVFAAIVALAVISEFFSLWSNLDLERVSMGRLLWLLATPSVFALLAYSVLPDECPENGLDLEKFYLSERRIWVLLFLVALLLDLARSIEQYIAAGQALWPFFTFVAPSLASMCIGLGVIYFSQRRLWSWVGLAVVSGAILKGLLGWVIRTQSVA